MKREIMKGTDLQLSKICYGTANFGDGLDEKQAFDILDRFVDGGGNFIDTANVYCRWMEGCDNSSEQYIGRWLKSRNGYHKVVIATKGGHFGLNTPDKSRVTEKGIKNDLEESLITLGVDQIDFYWLHRDNQNLPIEEIMDIMEGLVKEGKIRFYGASNYTEKRMEQAKEYAKKKGIQGFSALSNQWSLAAVNSGKNLNQDPTLVSMDEEYYVWHKKTNTPMVPFSSGAQGFFNKLYLAGVKVVDGKMIEKGTIGNVKKRLLDAYLNETNLKTYEKLCQLTNETGISIHTLSLIELMKNPFQVFPVVSASRTEQINEILKAGEDY